MFDPPAKHEERNWKDNLATGVGISYIGGVFHRSLSSNLFRVSFRFFPFLVMEEEEIMHR